MRLGIQDLNTPKALINKAVEGTGIGVHMVLRRFGGSRSRAR